MSNGTFFAEIEVTNGQVGEIVIDSRPSDAIAIALRTEAPIFVDETVMDDSFQLEEENNTIGVEKFEIEEQKEELENNLRKAVEMEKYEEAAVIRDQLKEYD
jgi:hypothetical protein